MSSLLSVLSQVAHSYDALIKDVVFCCCFLSSNFFGTNVMLSLLPILVLIFILLLLKRVYIIVKNSIKIGKLKL